MDPGHFSGVRLDAVLITMSLEKPSAFLEHCRLSEQQISTINTYYITGITAS
jgi:hypothetical protein